MKKAPNNLNCPHCPNDHPAIMTGLLLLASELQAKPVAKAGEFTIFATFLPLWVLAGCRKGEGRRIFD
jgi:hypothetical protein